MEPGILRLVIIFLVGPTYSWFKRFVEYLLLLSRNAPVF